MTAAWLPPFGTTSGEIARAGLVSLANLAIVAGAEWWRRARSPHPEWTRKGIHFAIGAIASFYPWIFARPETLVVLVLPSVPVIAWARSRGALPSIFGVDRRSSGEIYFPLSVVALFYLARGRPVFYLIAMLTMVVCDALAAVLGTTYGRHRYAVGSDAKSLEGSAAFLAAAFLVVGLPLLLLADLERSACVLIALQLALLVTSFEAVSTHGNDNWVVPLGTFYLLVKMTPKPAPAIADQLLAQLAILAFTLLVAWRTRFLSFSGALAAHLVLYAAYSLGGPAWIVAPLVTLASFLALDRIAGPAADRARASHRVPSIFYVSVAAILVLFVDNAFATLLPHAPPGLRAGHPFYALFAGALAAALSIGIAHVTDASRARALMAPWLRSIAAAVSGFLIVVPLALAAVPPRQPGRAFAISGLLCLAAVAAYRWARSRRPVQRDLQSELEVLSFSVLAATALVLPLHLAWMETP